MKLKKGKANLFANISVIFFIINIIIRIIYFVLMVKYETIDWWEFNTTVVIYSHILTLFSFLFASIAIIIAPIKQNKKCIIKPTIILVLDAIITAIRLFHTYINNIKIPL